MEMWAWLKLKLHEMRSKAYCILFMAINEDQENQKLN